MRCGKINSSDKGGTKKMKIEIAMPKPAQHVSVEELMSKSIMNYLTGDTIVSVIEEKVKEMVDEVISDSLNPYRNKELSVFKKQYGTHITGLLSEVDFQEILPSMASTLNKAVLEATVHEQSTLKGINNLIGMEVDPIIAEILKKEGKFEAYDRKIGIKEVFARYCAYASEQVDTTGLEVSYVDGISYDDIHCKYEKTDYFDSDVFTGRKASYHDSTLKKLVFTTEEDSSLEESVVLVVHWKSDGHYAISSLNQELSPDVSLYSSFGHFINQLRYYGFTILIDEDFDDNYIEVEEAPEATYQ